MIVAIALAIPTLEPLHYHVPASLEQHIAIGKRAKVPLGARMTTGFIVAVVDHSPYAALKDIESILDDQPVITDNLLTLARWMSAYYIISLGDILAAMVPRHIKAPKKPMMPIAHMVPTPSPITLNALQQQAVDHMVAMLDNHCFHAALLFGITGSGKTEVYMRLMERVISAGKSVIFLVPEIALTPHTAAIFNQRFHTQVAIFHSQMSVKQRKESWWRVKEGQASIVLGPRSAIFSPTPHLGLIIVDEEHDSSYKQEESPRYHARDVAVMRAHMEQIPIILGSATPSLESWHNATQGKYHLLSLDKRATGAQLPHISVVDMRHDPKVSAILSRQLFELIINRLAKQEQIILFINKRGSASLALCTACGHVERCHQCDIALTYHEHSHQLMCHYCGYKCARVIDCPSCQTPLTYRGMGTQAVEKEIRSRFPQARVARCDSDTLSDAEALDGLLEDFHAHRIDIFIGTQLIAKGLDCHNVTLIGIIASDISLNIPDFRSQERTYQLITQVSGRAGRGDKQGQVVVQSFNPGHESIHCAAYGSFPEFCARELPLRKTLGYPPFSHMIELIIKGKKEANVATAAMAVYRMIAAMPHRDVRLLGPSPMPIAYTHGVHRWHILLICPHYQIIQAMARHVYDTYSPKRGVRLFVNVDPVGMI